MRVLERGIRFQVFSSVGVLGIQGDDDRQETRLGLVRRLVCERRKAPGEVDGEF